MEEITYKSLIKLNELYQTWEYSISRTKEWGYQVRVWKREMPYEYKWTDSAVKRAIKESKKWVVKSEFSDSLEEAVNNLLIKIRS